jgi:hypothetical protein
MMITVTTIKKSTLAIVATLLFLFAVNTTSWAQASNTPAAGAKKYVRLDVGHGALHCPFLGPKLEEQYKKVAGISDFFCDRQKSYATFTLPANTEMTVESLQKIGIDVGYPAFDVVIKMDTKPIPAPTPAK